MVKGLHHVGVAVAEIEAAVRLHVDVLGNRLVRRGAFNGLDFALLDSGGVELELLSTRDPTTPLGKFIAERGPGLHHLAYAVPDLRAELGRLLEAGLEQSGEVRIGIHGTEIVFLHPKAAGGVLTELVHTGDGRHPA